MTIAIGAFWGTFAATLIPYYNAYGAYVTDPAKQAAWMGNPETQQGRQHQLSMPASVIFWSSWVRIIATAPRSLTNNATGLICFVFLICSIRTNIVFFIIFLSLVVAFGLLAGAYFNLALAYANPENTYAAAMARRLVVVSHCRYS